MSIGCFTSILAVVAICLAVVSFLLGAKNIVSSVGGWKKYLKGEFYKLGSLETVKGLLICIGVIIACTGLGYWRVLNFDALMEYANFAAPCLAGIVVGGGAIEAAKKASTIWSSVDFVYYFLSVLLIFIGYLSYLWSHYDAKVVAWALGITSLCETASLIWLFFRKKTLAKSGSSGHVSVNYWIGDASAAVAIGTAIGVSVVVFVTIFHGP